MPLTVLDRAAVILAAEAVIALPLSELAARIGAPPDLLVGALRGDPRFVLVRPHARADLELLDREGRAAYQAALDRAGLSDEPAVAVVRAPDSPGRSVADLVRATAIALLGADAESPVPGAARPLHQVLRLSLGNAGRAPSTIHPPGPPRPAPDPPPPPRPSPSPPRRP